MGYLLVKDIPLYIKEVMKGINMFKINSLGPYLKYYFVCLCLYCDDCYICA
jgi:hypothetical protein